MSGIEKIVQEMKEKRIRREEIAQEIVELLRTKDLTIAEGQGVLSRVDWLLLQSKI